MRLVCLLVCAALAFAQSGEIKIQVEDSSGAVVRASGTLTKLGAGVARTFETDAQGVATLSGLAEGRYNLEVVKQGFSAQAVVIDLGMASVTHKVTLLPGAQAFAVDVVSATPLPGTELSLDQIAGAVQASSAAEIKASGALDFADFLNKRMASVYLNETQGNPMQADLNYRGYSASPLLGTPQGVSVYMDGVRLNQPFGDVVSWDLIPRIAVGQAALIPGSDPLFGLNSLGGALSLQTKDGYTAPGTAIGISGGTFGRRIVDFEHGGSSSNGWNWYGASNLFFEDGWRDNSPSNVRQFFGKVGWQGAKTTLGASLSYANNSLIGNGLQEQGLLNSSYTSIYTQPDRTANRSPYLNIMARHAVNDKLTFFGNAYFRYIRTSTLNGDINDDSLDQSVYQPSAAERNALAAAGYTGFPTAGENASNTPFPKWRCIAQGLLRDEPAEKCNGLLNRGKTKQYNGGLTGQFTYVTSGSGYRNQLTGGAAWDRSSLDFESSTELGYLNPDRSVTGVGAFGDGVTGGDEDGVPFDVRVNLHGTINTGSVYFSDTLTKNRTNVTFSGRFNRTTIDNTDNILASGPGSLTGKHSFQRFNPSIGITHTIPHFANVYLRYSEASRAPTSIELGCADPENPCKLPNAMAGDPPLKQVVTRTWEAGLRGDVEGRLHWSAGWFRGQNRDDILFVMSEQTGYGYFKNFGKTLRQGLETDFDFAWKKVTFGLGYTYLDATFQSEEEVTGEGNSSNEDALAGRKGFDGTIEIQPGNKIPLVPAHMGKAFAALQLTRQFSLNLNMLAFSSVYARGNENNQHKADGVYYLGPGKSAGYAVFNLGGIYQVGRRMELFAQVNNLFDRHYTTGAQLATRGFLPNGNFVARPLAAVSGQFPLVSSTFLAPGAPRTAWGGIRVRF